MSTGDNVMLPILPFWAGYGALGLFFIFGRDAAAKRRFWPLYSLGSGAMFLWITWYVGALRNAAAILIPAVAVITWLNIRAIKFCDECGKMFKRGLLGGGPASCPKCGTELVDKQ